MNPIVCIGGGASVSAGDLARVGKAVLDDRAAAIAINSAVYAAWWSRWVYAADSKFWLSHIQRLQHFPGQRLSIADDIPRAWGVCRLTITGRDGYDPVSTHVRTGGGSGYQALHYAMQRTNRVILLGYDMAGPHWHGGYEGEPRADFANVMAPHFKTLVEPAQAAGVEILNCSDWSTLTCFPKATLSKLL